MDHSGRCPPPGLALCACPVAVAAASATLLAASHKGSSEDEMEDAEHTGRCLCGAVSFRATGPLRDVIYCHCSQCRRQTGHFYAATDLSEDRLEVSGAENITWFHASPTARRGFCRVCGSALFWQGEGRDRISVLAGSFDEPTGLQGKCHIFVADKGDYYGIDDQLPQFAASET